MKLHRQKNDWIEKILTANSDAIKKYGKPVAIHADGACIDKMRLHAVPGVHTPGEFRNKVLGFELVANRNIPPNMATLVDAEKNIVATISEMFGEAP